MPVHARSWGSSRGAAPAKHRISAGGSCNCAMIYVAHPFLYKKGLYYGLGLDLVYKDFPFQSIREKSVQKRIKGMQTLVLRVSFCHFARREPKSSSADALDCNWLRCVAMGNDPPAPKAVAAAERSIPSLEAAGKVHFLLPFICADSNLPAGKGLGASGSVTGDVVGDSVQKAPDILFLIWAFAALAKAFVGEEFGQNPRGCGLNSGRATLLAIF